MPSDPQAPLRRIPAAEGQPGAAPTFDHKRQRLQKQEKVGNDELGGLK